MASAQALPLEPLAAGTRGCLPFVFLHILYTILAPSSRGSGFSQALTTKPLKDFAEFAGIELLWSDENTRRSDSMREIRWGEATYYLKDGLKEGELAGEVPSMGGAGSGPGLPVLYSLTGQEYASWGIIVAVVTDHRYQEKENPC